jgi:peptidyl-prolyl cis-trans isomerase SurA
VEPPRPTREMVENMLLNEKHQLASQRILRELRRSAYIDYKDTSYTQ